MHVIANGSRSSGGMGVFVRFELIRYFHILESSSFRTWCKLDKACCDSDQDTMLCFVYIPPADSNWFKSGRSTNFDSLLGECARHKE